MIVVTNRENGANSLVTRLNNSEVRVGNNPASDKASATANPSCGVVVNDSGFFDCNLRGRYVTLRRFSNLNAEYHFAEIAVWTQKNICPKGVASMSSVFVDNGVVCSASKAQNYVAIQDLIRAQRLVARTDFNVDFAPYWQLDLGLEGLPIKTVLILGGTEYVPNVYKTGYSVSVGDSPGPFANTNCNSAPFSIIAGREQLCD